MRAQLKFNVRKKKREKERKQKARIYRAQKIRMSSRNKELNVKK